MWVSTGGLLTWNGKWNIQPEIKARVNSVTTDAQKQLWVATTNGLWRRSAGAWVNMDETMMDPGNGRTYFALQQQKEGAEILLSTLYSVGCISETGNHWVLRAADGLPFGPVKVIAPSRWLPVVWN
jgi:ligand-binding sensor domain-containing protein